MSAPELKPCPFCGGKPYLANVAMAGCAYVVCTDCRMQSDDGGKDRVVAAWNRRADLPPPATNPKWIKNCIKCSRIIDTREEEGGGDPHGCEYDAGWVCSSECADLYLSDADVMAHPKVLALETRLAEVEKERDEADDLAKAAFADGASNNIRLAEAAHRIKLLETRAEAAEALLSEAVMAHPKVRALVDAAEEQLDYLEMCGEDDDLVRNLRAALAELTGGKDDTDR